MVPGRGRGGEPVHKPGVKVAYFLTDRALGAVLYVVHKSTRDGSSNDFMMSQRTCVSKI
jgi:hypothetical protein